MNTLPERPATAHEMLRTHAIQYLIANTKATQAQAAVKSGTTQREVSTWLSKVRAEIPEALPAHLAEASFRNRRTIEEVLQEDAIQALIKDPKLTQAQASAMFDVRQPQISRWINRLRREMPEALPKHMLGDAAHAAHPAGAGYAGAANAQPLDAVPYPIYTNVSAGPFNGNTHEVNMEDPIGIHFSSIRLKQVPGYPPPFALRVNGHSMTNPQLDVDFPDGTIVLCNPALAPERWDYVVAINVVTNSMTFKQLVVEKTEAGEQLWLHALNPEYKDELFDHENFQVAGVVVDASLPKYTKKGVITRRR